MTPSEVAQRLRVDDTTVRRWIHAGILDAEAFQQGKRVRYRIKKSVVKTIERRDLPLAASVVSYARETCYLMVCPESAVVNDGCKDGEANDDLEQFNDCFHTSPQLIERASAGSGIPPHGLTRLRSLLKE